MNVQAMVFGNMGNDCATGWISYTMWIGIYVVRVRVYKTLFDPPSSNPTAINETAIFRS